MYAPLLFLTVTSLLSLAVAGTGTAFGQSAGVMSLEDFRQARHQLAHRQRRIIMNNDGCDVLYFPANSPMLGEAHWDHVQARATGLVCRDLVVSVSMTAEPGSNRNGRSR